MKKTTYILGAAIGVILMFCFFLPVIFFKAQDTSIKEREIVLKCKPGEKGQVTVLPEFHYLENIGNSNDYSLALYDTVGRIVTPRFRIVESDSISAPTLEVNPAWNGILKARKDVDGISVYIDVKQPEYDYVSIVIPEDAMEAGVLTVPKGMLTAINNSNFDISLYDFKDAELTLDASMSEFIAENCSFRKLVKQNNIIEILDY